MSAGIGPNPAMDGSWLANCVEERRLGEVRAYKRRGVRVAGPARCIKGASGTRWHLHLHACTCLHLYAHRVYSLSSCTYKGLFSCCWALRPPCPWKLYTTRAVLDDRHVRVPFPCCSYARARSPRCTRCW